MARDISATVTPIGVKVSNDGRAVSHNELLLLPLWWRYLYESPNVWSPEIIFVTWYRLILNCHRTVTKIIHQVGKFTYSAPNVSV